MQSVALDIPDHDVRLRDGIDGARTAYQDFLANWKSADLDIPILKQAKAEYANVQ